MKKYSVLAALVVILSLCACNQQNEPIATSEQSMRTTAEAPTQIALPNPLPQSESIKLKENPNDEFGNDWEYVYRFLYYGVPGPIFTLADYDGSNDENIKPFEPEPEMALVAFIKHYKIERKDFIEAVLKLYNFLIELGYDDIYDESLELPNADIIYTFDNEIINAYYRRENPVVPEPGTYTTYGSYEEYLKAQP